MYNNTILLYADNQLSVDQDLKEKRRKWHREWRARNKEYDRERKRKWDKNNPEKKKAKDKRYYQKHKEELNKKRTPYVREWRRKMLPLRRRSIIENVRGYQKKYYYLGKEQLFHILGHVCVKCGEFDKRCLQVDHINGGGNNEAKRLGRRGMIRYYSLHPEEARQKLQVLCANCNIKKVYENYENNYMNKSKLLEQIKKEVDVEG